MRDSRRVMIILAALLVALAGCEREKKAVKEDLPAARVAKAQADAAAIASAIATYSATCSELPESLDDLVIPKTVGGAPWAGPGPLITGTRCVQSVRPLLAGHESAVPRHIDTQELRFR